MDKVTLRIPATSANCGPGFDTLGLACTMYNEVTYEITTDRGFRLDVTGEGADYLLPFGKNLAFSSFLAVWNRYTDYRRIGLKVSMVNRIPMSRGLGSSSATIVGGIMAANLLSGAGLNKEELLDIATAIEGHPDNVAPALFGNFTISFMEDRKAHTMVLSPARPLKFIAVIPEMHLSTAQARKAIPVKVRHRDAVYNVSRSALLVGSLLSGDYRYLSTAMEDRLHQIFRSHLIPGLGEMFAAARAKGAYNGIISGAGSTVMAYADPDKDCAAIGAAMQDVLTHKGMKSKVEIFDLDTEGVKEI